MESSASAGMHQEGHNEALAQNPVVEVQRQVEGEANNVFSFSGDMITLLVGEKLYRVHEYLFTTNSALWRERLRARTDKTRTIMLDDVTDNDLRTFLNILYDTDFNGYEGRTTANWDSVLRLATLWEFKNIRALAINKVDPLATPLEKLAMDRAFDVSTWIRPSLVALCTRSEPLTLAEGRRLSTEDLISITSAREAVRNTQLAPNERDVSSYISEHILCERSTDAVVVSTVPTENVSGSPTSFTQPNLATSTIVKAPDVPPFTPWPSAHQVESLLAAISQSDFKSALDMASHEGAKAFIDALRNFTPVSRDPRMAERLTLAILHQGCRTSSFITIGVALFSELTAHFCTQITDDGTTWKLHPYLKWRSDTSHQFNDAMSLIRSQFRSFDLALRHITVAQPFGDPGWFLDILRAGESLSLTESVYDERYANLRTYFTRLEQAGLAYY